MLRLKTASMGRRARRSAGLASPKEWRRSTVASSRKSSAVHVE
jgi:hypothetical protein